MKEQKKEKEEIGPWSKIKAIVLSSDFTLVIYGPSFLCFEVNGGVFLLNWHLLFSPENLNLVEISIFQIVPCLWQRTGVGCLRREGLGYGWQSGFSPASFPLLGYLIGVISLTL